MILQQTNLKAGSPVVSLRFRTCFFQAAAASPSVAAPTCTFFAQTDLRQLFFAQSCFNA